MADNTQRRIVLDVDTGVDDALAILLALRSPELSVEAITTVAGNVEVDLATRNTRLVLDRLPAPDTLPVAQGAAAPLARELYTAPAVHGGDGLGNVSSIYSPPKHPLDPRPATEVILEAIRQHGEELTLLATGPMTNLALAARQDPDTFRRAGEIVQMGGAVGVPGNTGPWAEFNIYVDPEAVAEVLATGVPIRFVPLDVTHQVVLLRSELQRRMQERDSGVFQFAREITVFYFNFQQEKTGLNGGYLHDPTAVVAVFEPGLFIWEGVEMEIRTDEADRGRMVVRPAPLSHIQVATESDHRKILKTFTDRVCR